MECVIHDVLLIGDFGEFRRAQRVLSGVEIGKRAVTRGLLAENEVVRLHHRVNVLVLVLNNKNLLHVLKYLLCFTLLLFCS